MCENLFVPMRQDCRWFESRTYSTGETVRKCHLDLAPEAPWRCPDDCPRYEKRRVDVNWTYGTLVTPRTPEEPPAQGVAELLEEAEEIVNAAGRALLDEADKRDRRRRRWFRFGGRRRGGD